MSTTPVRITMRANEWGIMADILEDAAEEAENRDQHYFAAVARKYADMLNNKIKDR